METNRAGQVSYQQEADKLVPEGCIASGNEHGGCLDRGCRWCLVYYDGPAALDGNAAELVDDFNADYDF
jgi:hypothetical protein